MVYVKRTYPLALVSGMVRDRMRTGRPGHAYTDAVLPDGRLMSDAAGETVEVALGFAPLPPAEGGDSPQAARQYPQGGPGRGGRGGQGSRAMTATLIASVVGQAAGAMAGNEGEGN